MSAELCECGQPKESCMCGMLGGAMSGESSTETNDVAPTREEYESNETSSLADLAAEAGIDDDMDFGDITIGDDDVADTSIQSPQTTEQAQTPQSGYQLHETNAIHDLVKHSRANQVLNEEPTMMMVLIYTTGWLPDPKDYAAAFISGGSGQGKSHMKESVVDPLYSKLPEDTLYDPVGASEQGIMNDPEWDDCTVGALNEMNKLDEKQIEFFKTVYDPKGFSYVRSVRDSDVQGGFRGEEIHREPKPYVMMIADENAMEIDPELLNRLVEIRISESPELSEEVGSLAWGHDTATIEDSPHEYNTPFDAGTEALQAHIKNMPVMPVVIPADEQEWGWDAWEVIKPIINFYQEDAKRVAGTLASLCKSSALFNYHARERTYIDGVEHIVAAPQDVGNLLCARRTILSSTHNLNDKKFAIIDAFEDIGGHTAKSGSKRQLEFEQIRDYLGDRKDLPIIPKKQLQTMLEEMNERYIISIEDHPQDANKDIYVYSGGSVFGEPNIGEYPELFENLQDPIRGCTVAETVRQIQSDLGANEGADIITSDESEFAASESDSEGSESSPQASLTGAAGGTRIGRDELSAGAQEVLPHMSETLADMWIDPDEMDDIRLEHMCGAAPTETYLVDPSDGSTSGSENRDSHNKDGDRTYLRAIAEPTSRTKEGTIFDPDHEHWTEQDLSEGEVRAEVEDLIGELRAEKFFTIEEYEDGSYNVVIR